MNFEQTLQATVVELRKRHPHLDEDAAIAKALNDNPSLYMQYRQASWTIPMTPETREAPQASAAEAEVLRRAEGLVAKTAGMDLNAAVTQVLAEDAALYRRYVVSKQDETAPRFGEALMATQLDDLYEYTGALMRTLSGILASDANDKGTQLAGALRDFQTAMIGRLNEAGLEVPTEKREHPLAHDVLALATALNPEDPMGRGLVRSRIALEELTKMVRRKGAAA